jgi:glycosyltransferase involved in cell wall biosynthesis
MIKRIVLITGSFPPEICGVGDYTLKLASKLAERDQISVSVFAKKDWRLRMLLKYIQELKAQAYDIYHLQYPTEGYGYSLLPLFLIFLLRNRHTVVTIHELSSRNFSAYLYTLFLIMLSGKVIVSNEYERKYATRFLFNKQKVTVIPIASNIDPSPSSERNFVERAVDVAYFGHIRPMKGLEVFLETLASFGTKVNVAVIGQSLPKYLGFFEEVAKRASLAGIDIIENKNSREVSELLADTKILYLPFPDGISNRRGSLLAGIQNGCAIVSTKSPLTEVNEQFEPYCYLVNSSDEATGIIKRLLAEDINVKNSILAQGLFSWENVVREHENVYDYHSGESVLKREG